MWPKNFKDYPNDTPLKHQKVESGKGIIGCEMHEQMGWGADHHIMAKPKKPGFIRKLFYKIFGAPK